ncbi:flagellin [Heyndrickxia faecalis]|uniref:flagellin N-terminal helical domain-containing protein n=1 Tax=Heyndrickxia TaxID=2837504 RepID=UPI002E244B32|nr:flagellin [Weizmannia sp. CD-2023]MED4976985.1 flagellin [Weizmannia sp. CD-2023]
MIINHNIAALNTLNHLNAANNAQSKSMQKLSSGLRINSAADDAAGLAISEKMRSQIRGLDQASRNAQDGISLVQTAEGALNETTDILQRMRELSVQAANDTNTDDDRKEIQKEMNQLTSEVNRIGNTTEFNTQKLLDGTKAVSTSGATSGTAATSFTNATAMTPASDNSVTKHPTVQGKYTGTSDITLTVKYDHTNSKFQYSTDGDNWEDFTDNSATVDGITITTSDAGTSTTDDLIWTVDLKKATTGTPGTTSGSGITLQIGANQSQTFTVEINDMRAGALGISSAATDATGVNKDVTGAAFTTGSDNELTDKSGTATTEYALDVTDATKASAATKVIDEAIKTVSSERARLGAYENRLDHTVNNLSTSSENLTSAESRIRDVDYALAA